MTPTAKDFAILKSQFTKMRELKDVLYEALESTCEYCIGKEATDSPCERCITGKALRKARGEE